jgi:hypothetical protein
MSAHQAMSEDDVRHFLRYGRQNRNRESRMLSEVNLTLRFVLAERDARITALEAELHARGSGAT